MITNINKKIMLIIAVGLVFIPLMAATTQTVDASTFTRDYKYCDDINHVNTSFDGGRLAYGCNTHLGNESYATFSKNTSSSYRGKVRTGNGDWGYGGYKNQNDQSEAQVGFQSGTQLFGEEAE